MLKKLLILSFLTYFVLNAQSQTYTLNSNLGTNTTCSGTFTDGNGNYGNNADYTVTFCSGSSALINVDFSQLNLEAGWDFLEVYDGPTTGSPLLDNITGNIGTYVLQSSGSCLTFHFTSDFTGTRAGWTGVISCVVPCSPPTAGGAVTNHPAPVKVCLNEAINFSGASSTAAGGFSISSYDWDFDDGNTGTGVTTSHSYATAGEYLVQLTVTDNNNCTNNNLIDLVVQVGTEPTFVGTTPNQTVCVGENVCLDGVINPTPWQDIPSTTVAGTTTLPDGSGVCYNAPLTFTEFTPGSTITNGNQILDVFANMEHTWAGDLSIHLECPNGQQVGLFNEDQTWNTTNISSENFGDPGAGVGFDYTWVNTGSTIDDWGAANPGAGTGTSIPAGTYASEEPFSNLVGCPLNGTWQLLICDWFSSDDGTVFSWGMDFDPSLYAGISGFTPVFNNNCAGTSWSGVNAASNSAITSTSGNCNQVCVPPPATGNYSYTFSGTDDFGCTFDTTITITATAGAIANAGIDISYCSGASGTIGSAPVGGVTYSWTPTTGLSSGTAANPTVTLTNGTGSPVTTTYIVTASAGSCSTTDTVDVTVNPQPTAGFNQPTAQCLTGNSFDFNNSGTTGATYAWDFGDANTSTNENPPNHTYATSGTFTVTQIVSFGACADTATLDVVVNPMPIPTATADSVFCNGGSTGSATVTGVTNSPGGFNYSWNSTPVQNTQTATGLPAGTYTVTVTDQNTTCTGQTTATVFQPPVLTATESHVDPLCTQGTDGTATANPSGGTNSYTYSWNTTPVQTTQTATGLAAGNYTCTITDFNGCTFLLNVTILDGSVITANYTLPANQCLTGNSFTFTNTGTTGATYNWNFGDAGTSSIESPTHNYATAGTYAVTQIVSAGTCADTITQSVTVYPMPIPYASGTDVLCNGDLNGVAQVDSVTNSVGPFSYQWDAAAGNQTTFNATNLSDGTYTVTVTDQTTNCSAQTNVTINEPPVLSATESHVDPLCNGDANGTATASPTGGIAPYSYSWNTTPIQTTQTATGLVDGTYTCTITDTNGCTTTTTAILNEPAGIVLSTSSTLANCGANDGSATVNVTSGGSGTFSYLWDAAAGNQNTATASNLLAGTYTVTVTDDVTSCTKDTTVTVSSTTAITVNAIFINDALCNGSADGMAYADVSGGTAPFTYSWNSTPVQTGDTLTTIAGTYNLTVTDSNGCTGNDVVNIGEPTPVLAAIPTSTDVSCFGLTDGNATASGSGGTGGTYTYSWNTTPIQTTATATGLDDGTYIVTVTDSNSCTDTEQITIQDGLVVTAGFIIPTPQCLTGNSFTFNNNGTTGGGTTFEWNFGDAGTSVQEDPAHTYSTDGTFNVTQIIYAGVCSDTITQSITVYPMPIPTASSDSVNCNAGNDGSVTVTGITNSPGSFPNDYTYLWTPGGATTSTATGLTVGNYTVTVTDTSTGCTGQVSVDVYEPTPVTASITSSQDESCLGANDGTATLGGVGGTSNYTYSWNTTPVQNIQTAIGLAPGSYWGYVYDGNMCVDSVQVTINAGPLMTATHTSTDVSCFGGSNATINETISGNPGAVTYNWMPGAIASEDPVGLTAGTYYLTATSGGCQVMDTVVINEPTPLVAAIDSSFDVVCNGGTDGMAYGSASGGTGGVYTYSWNTTPVQNTATATDLAQGTYTLTVNDSNSCQTTVNVNINEPAALNVDTGSVAAYCGVDQGTVWVNPTNGSAPYTYIWDSAGTVISGADTVNGLYPGSYHVQVLDNNGCKYVGDVVVSTAPGGTVSISNSTDVSCFGGADGTATVSASGAFPGFTYLWDAAAGNQTTNPATGLANGAYGVTVTDTFGCVMTTSVTITEPTAVGVTLTAYNKICYNSCDAYVDAVANGGTASYTFNWNDPSSQITPTATGLCPGMVTVIVTDSKGCTVSDSVLITNPAEIVLSSTTASASCNQADGGATVNVVSNGIAPFTYSWSDGVSVISAVNNLTNVVAGTYYATVTDSLGCVVSDTVTIANASGPQIDSTSSVDILCFGGNNGSATVYVSGGATPYIYTWNDPASQSTPTATNLIAGSYILNITDTNGCNISTSMTINEPSQLQLTFGGLDPTCTGYTDGIAWVNAQGGTMPYSYSWNDPLTQTNDTAVGLPAVAGGYTVTVTDSNGCFGTENVGLSDPALFTIDVTGTDVSCFGGNDGSAVVSENGFGPFQYTWDDPSAQSTQTASSLTANTYNVQVSDVDGCIANGSIVINEPNELIMTEDTVFNVSCNGFSDGAAAVNVTGGSGAYSFTWDLSGSIVSTQQNPTGLAAGNYLVTVTDTNGCNDQLLINVTEPSSLAATATPVDVLCANGNSGYAFVNANGGTQPYSYQWDANAALQQTDTAFNLTAGTYSVDVTDSNGCVVNITNIVIDEPTALALATSTVSSTCGDNNGSATVNVGGGSPPFNFAWNSVPTQTTAIASNLFAGSYTVVITDFNGCQDSITANVVDLGSPTVTIPTSTDVSCFGAADGSATADVTGGTAPYTYAWNTTPTQNTLTATGLDALSYSVTVTDSNGCTSSANITIQQANALVAVIGTPTNVSCNGGNDGEAFVSIAGGIAPFTYTWNDPLGQTTDTASTLSAGDYIVQVSDSNNCLAFDTVTISEPTILTLSLDSLKDVNCFGGNDGYINIIAAGGSQPYVSYAWTPNVSSGPSANGLTVGNYTVTITDNNGCTVSDNYDILEPTQLIITTDSTDATCGNDNGIASVTSTVGGTAPYSYNWNDPTNQTTATASDLFANMYTVVVTDDHGCTVTDMVTVNDNPGPIVDSVSTVNPLCNGDNNGSAQVFASGNGPFSYQWTPSGQITDVASGLVAGVYSVVVSDVNSCSVTMGGIVLNEPLPLTADIDMPSTACYGQVIQFFGVGGGGTPFTEPQDPYDVIWLAPFNTTGEGPFYDTVTTNFTYNIVIQDANGCIRPYSENITVGNPLQINATGDLICLGDTATITASATGGLMGGTYEYTWLVYDSLTGNTTVPVGVNNPSTSPNVNVYTTDTTDYIVYVSDGCSMNDTAGLVVQVKDTAIVTFSASNDGCPYPTWSVGFEVSGDNWNSTYHWDVDGDGVTDITSQNDSVSYPYSNSGTYDVGLTVVTENGCSSSFIHYNEVNIWQVPVADFASDPDIVTIINPTYDFSDLSSPDVNNWNWNFGDYTSDLVNQNPSHTYQDTGFYAVTLIASNGLCEDTITKNVVVKPDFFFAIPNTFTPQGDGINEIFKPGAMIGVAENDYTFLIFNRWGEKIYEGHDIEDGWDGTVKGGSEPAQTGVYVWLIKLKGIDGPSREYTGHVNVLK